MPAPRKIIVQPKRLTVPHKSAYAPISVPPPEQHTYFAFLHADFWTLTGRASRKVVWGCSITYYLVILAMVGVAFLAIRNGIEISEKAAMAFMVLGYALGVFAAAMSIPLSVRRLHDLNVSGWLFPIAIIVSIIPVVGWYLFLLYLLALIFMPGTRGPNKYGADPLGRQPLPGTAQNVTRPLSVEERLSRLNNMYTRGIISAEEYETQRARIIADA